MRVVAVRAVAVRAVAVPAVAVPAVAVRGRPHPSGSLLDASTVRIFIEY